jgi:hypothetical protein
MRNEFAFRCQCVATPTAGLRPPLFVGVRSCIAKIVFSPANIRTPTQERGASAPVENITPLQVAIAHQRRYACVQPRAAGVSQPWFRKRACSSNTAIVAHGRPADRPYTNAVAVTLPNSRRAYARRSLWACVCASQKSFFRRQTFALQHKSGGRQPPVATINTNATAIRTYTVGGPANNRACVCAIVFLIPTAGSRPPLFVDVRLCIAKIVFSSANIRIPTQERGVSPAWRT